MNKKPKIITVAIDHSLHAPTRGYPQACTKLAWNLRDRRKVGNGDANFVAGPG
jgi:hypothetical protein